MRRTDEAGARGAAAFLARPLIIAVVVILLIAGYIAFVADRDPPASEMPEDVGTRPTGAGTLPDGAADQRIGSGTTADEIIDNSSQGDLRPEILDPTEGPPPATSVEDLDPPAPVDDDVLEPGPPDD
jgi:hypothetical protein